MTDTDLEDMKEIFRSMDSDGNGTINIKELVDFLEAIGDGEIDRKQISDIFMSLDNTGDRIIEFDEFKSVMESLRDRGWTRETKEAEQINEDDIRKVFSIVDKDGSGYLSRREAKRACKLIGEKFGITEVESWLADVDVDGDGQLSYAEFKMSLAGNLLIDI